jgi:hypothetical protein
MDFGDAEDDAVVFSLKRADRAEGSWRVCASDETADREVRSNVWYDADITRELVQDPHGAFVYDLPQGTECCTRHQLLAPVTNVVIGFCIIAPPDVWVIVDRDGAPIDVDLNQPAEVADGGSCLMAARGSWLKRYVSAETWYSDYFKTSWELDSAQLLSEPADYEVRQLPTGWHVSEYVDAHSPAGLTVHRFRITRNDPRTLYVLK